MREENSDSKIKIMLVEDHTDFRESMTYLLNSNEQFVCKPYAKAEDALPQLKNDLPDVILMDINLPGISGIECARIVKERYPAIQILMCTVYEDDIKIFDALKAGASGYMLKRAAIDEIFNSIVDLYNGGSPMSPSIARKVVDSFQALPQNNELLPVLSKREKEILDIMSDGFRIKEIADQLNLSINTVRSHIRNIYEKLQVTSRMEAMNKVGKNPYQRS